MTIFLLITIMNIFVHIILINVGQNSQVSFEEKIVGTNDALGGGGLIPALKYINLRKIIVFRTSNHCITCVVHRAWLDMWKPEFPFRGDEILLVGESSFVTTKFWYFVFGTVIFMWRLDGEEGLW